MATTTTTAAKTAIAAGRTGGRESAALRRSLIYIGYTIGLVLVAGPFVWMVAGAFKTAPELHRIVPTFLPAEPTLDNFNTLFQKLNFPLYFLNSAVVAFFVVGANLLFCSMLGYALTKLHFPGRDKIFLLVMATLMVPSTVTLVPLFVLMSAIGLVNTYAGLILPFAAGPFGVFLMRQFIGSIPDDLIEAARIDGASELRIFRSVVMPLCGTPLATLGIFTFLASWNNFLWPLVVSTSERMYTLPVGVATFSIGQHSSDYGTLMAGSVLLVAPVLIVFLLLQRYFTQGIAMTGIKG
ncbi:MAG: carbohydrate ABC transporter permease [Candidatus Dormibacteraeota bacterium]|uniref:carbohydrate ABC transporter permease n=1 Tax=Candidatus Dormibacter sp. TaxID=2973982 RepID=UPI000DB254D8|nr:carbohydrate ABC transporter permease [Candidatus Dormibacteraeota bacterium]PZR66155.1 MAG: sugar ABC transporter permease [Candidatus Dormibacteraeota bacterium]